MREFYRGLVAGHDRADGLRDAMLAIRRSTARSILLAAAMGFQCEGRGTGVLVDDDVATCDLRLDHPHDGASAVADHDA
jgi:hypothetical protein